MAPPGAIREVFFQLAFGAYLGAFFNLNPFLDRDGYNILVDVLREPGFAGALARSLPQRLSGTVRGEQMSPCWRRYAIAGVIWSAVGAASRSFSPRATTSRLSGCARTSS